MQKTIMKAKTQLNRDAQMARLIYLLRRTILVNAILAGVVLASGLGLLIAYLVDGRASEELKQASIWVLCVAVVVVLCVALIWGMVYFAHRPKEGSYEDITSFEFGEKSFKCAFIKKQQVGEGFNYTYDYVYLKAAAETKKYFFLSVNSQNVLIVDKAGFATEAEVSALHDILKKELGKRFKIKDY